MDKNTLNALILIALLFFVYSMIVQPPPETQQTTTNDSTAVTTTTTPQTVVDNTPKIVTDSLGQIVQQGLFAQATTTEEFATLENDLVKIKISNKGGRIYTTAVSYTHPDAADDW